MTCLNPTPPASGTVPAVLTLTLPQSLIAQAMLAAREDAGCSEAAGREYASWMPDRGAIELASWAIHLRATVQ